MMELRLFSAWIFMSGSLANKFTSFTWVIAAGCQKQWHHVCSKWVWALGGWKGCPPVSGSATSSLPLKNGPLGPKPVYLSSTNTAMPMGHALHPVVKGSYGGFERRDHLFPCLRAALQLDCTPRCICVLTGKV